MLSISTSGHKSNGHAGVSTYRKLNPNRHVKRFLEKMRSQEANKFQLLSSSAQIISDPTQYFQTITNFDHITEEGRFIEGLVENNILAQEDGETTYALFKSFINAAQVGALYHSLSGEYKTKFYEIVKAFDLAIQKNPKLKDTMTDMVIEGGEIRVVASGAAVIVINAITSLLGIKLQNFYGSSAGAFLALGEAVRAPNHAIFNNSAYTDYETFYGNRQNLIDWLKFFANEGYSFNTGRHIDQVTQESLKELGSNFQALVSEHQKGWFLNPFRKFITDDYFLPEAFKAKFDDLTDYDLASLATISANLVCFFFWPWDTTFGNCYYEDPDGNKRYFIDPGVKHPNMIPIQGLEEKLNHYASNYGKEGHEEDLLPFGFIIKNKKPEKKMIPKDELAEYMLHLRKLNMITGFRRLLFVGFHIFSNIIDINQKSPWDRIHELGLDPATVEASCTTRDPENGSLHALFPGYLKNDPRTKEAVILSNIPTKEFSESPYRDSTIEYPVLDQLHDKFVDKEYIESNGKRGKSPFDIYKQSIHTAFELPEPKIITPSDMHPNQAALIARNLLVDNKQIATK